LIIEREGPRWVKRRFINGLHFSWILQRERRNHKGSDYHSIL